MYHVSRLQPSSLALFSLRGGVLRVLLPLALVGAAAGVTSGILMGLQGKKTAHPKKVSPPLPQRKK